MPTFPPGLSPLLERSEPVEGRQNTQGQGLMCGRWAGQPLAGSLVSLGGSHVGLAPWAQASRAEVNLLGKQREYPGGTGGYVLAQTLTEPKRCWPFQQVSGAPGYARYCLFSCWILGRFREF